MTNTALDSRGYTGHEHLDGVELIHMNGRVFDPVSALFISADPNIPDASNQYYMNRYSYGFNNPVTFTDPSGYWNLDRGIRKLGRKIDNTLDNIGREAGRFANSEAGKMAAGIGITIMTGGAGAGWALAGGFGSGYVMTGSLEGAAIGAIFAGASFGVGEIAGQISNAYAAAATRAVMHGALGGIRARMNGGSFSSGFRSAGLVSIVGDVGGAASFGIKSDAGQIAAAAVLGGTVSEISGGKFANGAISGAFVHAYNAQNLRNHYELKEMKEMSVQEAMETMSSDDAAKLLGQVKSATGMALELVKLNLKMSEIDRGSISMDLQNIAMARTVPGVTNVLMASGSTVLGVVSMVIRGVGGKLLGAVADGLNGRSTYDHYDIRVRAEAGNNSVIIEAWR